MANTAEQILTDFLVWVKALDENRLEELEVDFTDPELISKIGRLRDPVKWAKANEEMQQKARLAATLEIELIQAIDDVLTRGAGASRCHLLRSGQCGPSLSRAGA